MNSGNMYSKEIQDMLKKKKIEVGDIIEIKKEDKTHTGILMPRINT